MKKVLFTLALTATFGLASIASTNSFSAVSVVVSEGEHKCDDKCKKDKDGKCAEAKSDDKEGTGTVSSCCKKGEKSCSDSKSKKGKSKKNKDKS